MHTHWESSKYSINRARTNIHKTHIQIHTHTIKRDHSKLLRCGCVYDQSKQTRQPRILSYSLSEKPRSITWCANCAQKETYCALHVTVTTTPSSTEGDINLIDVRLLNRMECYLFIFHNQLLPFFKQIVEMLFNRSTWLIRCK